MKHFVLHTQQPDIFSLVYLPVVSLILLLRQPKENDWYLQFISFSRVEIPLKNRSRFERFERFSSKIWPVWAVWAVWAVFFEKPLKPLKSCLKNLAVIFERFFKQDLSGFWADFPGRAPRLNVSLLCKTRTNTFIQGRPICSNFPKSVQKQHFWPALHVNNPTPPRPNLHPPPPHPNLPPPPPPPTRQRTPSPQRTPSTYPTSNKPPHQRTPPPPPQRTPNPRRAPSLSS